FKTSLCRGGFVFLKLNFKKLVPRFAFHSGILLTLPLSPKILLLPSANASCPVPSANAIPNSLRFLPDCQSLLQLLPFCFVRSVQSPVWHSEQTVRWKASFLLMPKSPSGRRSPSLYVLFRQPHLCCFPRQHNIRLYPPGS